MSGLATLSDCGLRIADFGLRIGMKTEVENVDPAPILTLLTRKSAIRNPQSAIT